MDQLIRNGDHRILGETTSTLVGCILIVVIYATTAMLSSKNSDTWNRPESIELTAKAGDEGILPHKYGMFTTGKIK